MNKLNESDLSVTLNINYRDKVITPSQAEILKLILETKSQNKVAQLLDIPPSTVNIQLKRLEAKLGVNLAYASPAGTVLSEEAYQIVKYYTAIKERVSKTKFIACGFVSGEVGKILFDDVLVSSFSNILKLHKSNLTDTIGIDDPYWSYRIGDPIPVAYDHFLMVSKGDFNFKNLLGVNFSAHRIVWKTLKNEKIDFRVSKVVKNPFYAIDLLEEGYSMFINKCLLRYVKKEYNIETPNFYEKTKYTINFISNEENFEENFEDLVLKKHNEIKSAGFEPIL
ncbi:transcriptional regulator, LysR family [Methanococcus vannielii SB]|uniref:Transcriptional regulator, LysR family n=1 Tax=Methanococcus vannielii (strain ATCC 35089 / DSM 1224 / JCM 13029 / OCM 148 / SB) TaxID=406327 RepID=A6URH9_METVS|nr:LysR family transcriptional regulator [Methanococcus vannielii]ABR55101.1 transcriptional regulator, LysR family [Methanococcus vannielii SB]